MKRRNWLLALLGIGAANIMPNVTLAIPMSHGATVPPKHPLRVGDIVEFAGGYTCRVSAVTNGEIDSVEVVGIEQ